MTIMSMCNTVCALCCMIIHNLYVTTCIYVLHVKETEASAMLLCTCISAGCEPIWYGEDCACTRSGLDLILATALQIHSWQKV